MNKKEVNVLSQLIGLFTDIKKEEFFKLALKKMGVKIPKSYYIKNDRTISKR